MKTQKTVLLFEDMPFFYEQVGRAMKALGWRVIRLVGALEIGEDHLQGITPRARVKDMLKSDGWDGDEARLVDVSLADVALVLLDASLAGPLDAPTQILPVLLKARVPVVAISGSTSGNAVLRSHGATMTLNKVYLVAALKAGLIDPILARRNPIWVAALLQVFEEEKHGELLAQHSRIPRAA